MRRTLLVGTLICAFSLPAWAGQFYGELVLEPNPNDPAHKTKILQKDFGFEDANGVRWQAGPGEVTDGASIPPIFQPIIGGPWEEGYVPAAVLHDHYCTRNVRKWQATHRMFYDALITSKVPPLKAKLMYYAVYTFGPKWGVLIKGKFCGDGCQMQIIPEQLISKPSLDLDLNLNSMPESEYFRAYLPPRYDDPGAPAELAEAEKQIEAIDGGEGASLDDIERLSDSKHLSEAIIWRDIPQE